MPSITNDYSFISGAIEGQPATGVNFISRSFLNESGAVLPYGRALIWSTGNSRIELPSATGASFLGVSKRTTIYENALDAQGFDGFPADRDSDYLTSGDIYVYVETDVNPGDPVYFRHTANGAGKDVLGRFRNDDDGGSSTVDQVTTGAKWVGSYSAGEFAILNVNLG